MTSSETFHVALPLELWILCFEKCSNSDLCRFSLLSKQFKFAIRRILRSPERRALAKWKRYRNDGPELKYFHQVFQFDVDPKYKFGGLDKRYSIYIPWIWETLDIQQPVSGDFVFLLPRFGDVFDTLKLIGTGITHIWLCNGTSKSVFWSRKFTFPKSNVYLVLPFMMPILCMLYQEVKLYIRCDKLESAKVRYGFLTTSDRNRLTASVYGNASPLSISLDSDRKLLFHDGEATIVYDGFIHLDQVPK